MVPDHAAGAPRFVIHRNEPLIALAQAHGWPEWAVALGVLAALLLPSIIVAAGQGTLVSRADPFADLRALLLGRQGTEAIADVPISRDYMFLVVTGLFSIHAGRMTVQWPRLGRLPELLRDAALLAPVLSDEPTFRGMLDKYGARLNSPFLVLTAVLSAVVAGPLVLASLLPGGLYARLPGSPTGHLEAWWAAAIHPFGFAVLVVTACLYVYVIAKQGLVGLFFLLLLVEAWRKARSAGQPLISLRSPWGKVELALAELRAAILDVVISITLLFSAFGALCLWVSVPELVFVAIVGPFLILDPLFLIVPTLAVDRAVAASWRQLVEAADLELAEAVRAGSSSVRPRPGALALRVATAAATRERLDRIPNGLVSWRGVVGGLIVYGLPLLLIVPAFLGD